MMRLPRTMPPGITTPLLQVILTVWRDMECRVDISDGHARMSNSLPCTLDLSS